MQWLKKVNHHAPWLKLVVLVWLITGVGLSLVYAGALTNKAGNFATRETSVERAAEDKQTSNWQEVSEARRAYQPEGEGKQNQLQLGFDQLGQVERQKNKQEKSERLAKTQKKQAKVRAKQLKGKKLVALTFDDGPSEQTTGRLLDILGEKKALVTFFVLGIMERARPELAQRAEREGHEVETHTMYHQNLAGLPIEAAMADYAEAVGVHQSVSKKEPRYVRLPYGLANEALAAALPVPMIGWSVDSLDWQDRNAELVWQRTVEPIFDGAIVLMHDIYPTTIEAIPRIIDTLRGQGYEFVTIEEMAKIRGVTPVRGVLYREFLP